MTNTTPADIISALETTVTALTPSGGTTVGTQSAYAVLEEQGYSEDAEEVSDSDLDRQYVVQNVQPQDINIIGRSTHNQVTGTFELAIGHQVAADYGAGRDRRDKDLQQIVQQVIHVNNRPAGVGVIRYKGMQSSITKQGQFFWSVLTFEIVYYVLATYGS